MKFVMLPTWDVPPASYNERGDTSRFMALPMPGERIEDVDGTAIDGTEFPLVMTTEQLCKWWHRVRTWEVIANHPLWPVNQSVTLTLDESSVNSLDEEITMDKETATDWYCAGIWTGNFVWTDGLSIDRTAYFTLTVLKKPDFVNDFRPYYLDADFTRILPYFRLQANGDGIDGNLWAADSAAFYDEVGKVVNGTASAAIDGVAPSLTAAFDAGSGFEDDPMTLTLTPSLFWEYRDADGLNPKYDSLTGAIL